jgi:hypothetical protein
MYSSSGKEVFLASALEVIQESDDRTTTMPGGKKRSLAHFFFLQM